MTIEFNLVSKDARREIYSNADLLSNGSEISIIKLHKGRAIGGCWHTNDEHFVVWQGRMEVIMRWPEGETRRFYSAGEGGTFPKGISHAMIAYEDCLASEWGITPAEKCMDQKDPALRAEVDAINGKLS
jgi:mannose-6-phosphate isomerase-like protein (cupin superfamily)